MSGLVIQIENSKAGIYYNHVDEDDLKESTELEEAADDFGTAVARVEDIAAWIEANTDVELGPSARDAINKYARGLADRLMAAH